MSSDKLPKTAIVWFRQDLRLNDNPALSHAIENNYAVLPVFILDDHNAKEWRFGAASRWWLHHSLIALNKALSGNLHLFRGDAHKVMHQIIDASHASAVFWNRCYEPWRINRDKAIKTDLQNKNIQTQSFNASQLWEPRDVLKDDGTPYKVFTPYYQKGVMSRYDTRMHQTAPGHIFFSEPVDNLALRDLKLLPSHQWPEKMARIWTPGESGAQLQLHNFLGNALKDYKSFRDRPDYKHTSCLSPHLHFGEISPHRVWNEATSYALAHHLEEDLEIFCKELGWREFSCSLLYHNPSMPEEPLQQKFKLFQWRNDRKQLKYWQRGQTGVPVVDAGMRQLWQEGWMHNRVRMITASYLVKNLRLHWHEGQKWFWDCLVDANLANNSANWQWVAGCGADAAPYFRIFNPVTQGKKFDPDGSYIRKYVPELSSMPTQYIHNPWEAPQKILKTAGITLNKNYPAPLVNLQVSRQKALACWREIK